LFKLGKISYLVACRNPLNHFHSKITTLLILCMLLALAIGVTLPLRLLFTNGGTCLFDIVHSALWGSQYPVCTPDTQVLFLSGACMLHTQHSAVQTHTGGVWTVKAPFFLPASSSSTQKPFPSREKSAELVFRTRDLSDQSQAL
jgi:hypothetical protein